MSLWLFRAIFIIVTISVLLVFASSRSLSNGDSSTSWWVVVIGGLGLIVFFLLLDILTPRRKLTSWVGAFIGLLVGILISAVLASVVDMVGETYGVPLVPEAGLAIKWMLGVSICYLTISRAVRLQNQLMATGSAGGHVLRIKGAIRKPAQVRTARRGPGTVE